MLLFMTSGVKMRLKKRLTDAGERSTSQNFSRNLWRTLFKPHLSEELTENTLDLLYEFVECEVGFDHEISCAEFFGLRDVFVFGEV